MPGPMPNRDEDLSRDRARRGAAGIPAATKGELRPVFVPEPDEDWHPIARMMWDGLEDSGIADFFQQSDWAWAYHMCEEISLYKSPQYYDDKVTGERTEYHKRNGQILTAINSGFERLGMTEGDRRRMRIELEAPPTKLASVSELAVAGYRQDLETSAQTQDANS